MLIASVGKKAGNNWTRREQQCLATSVRKIYTTRKDPRIKRKRETDDQAARDSYTFILHDVIDFRYESLQLCGRGAFGTVVLCDDKKNKTPPLNGALVAIKVFNRQANKYSVNEIKIGKELMNLSKRAAFDEEQEIGSENVITYLREFYLFDRQHIVYEAIVGMSLHQLLSTKDGGILNPKDGRVVLLSVTKGLSFLHHKSIAHFDLKTDNIMVKMQTHQVASAVVIDLGNCATLADVSKTSLDRLMHVAILSHKAPECLFGYRARIGVKTDMWSLGVVAVHMLFGRVMFLLGNSSEANKLPSAEKELCYQWKCCLGEISDFIDHARFTNRHPDPWLNSWVNSTPPVPPLHKRSPVAALCRFGEAGTHFPDFMAKCWQYDSVDRSSAFELLSHPYLL